MNFPEDSPPSTQVNTYLTDASKPKWETRSHTTLDLKRNVEVYPYFLTIFYMEPGPKNTTELKGIMSLKFSFIISKMLNPQTV